MRVSELRYTHYRSSVKKNFTWMYDDEALNMFVQTIPTMNFDDGDGTSGSGVDIISMQNGHKPQSSMPSSSGLQKRSRKATSDAIVDAVLEIAAASKMRATALMTNEDPFSISKCIKTLDEMQGVDEHIYFQALDFFENPNARETFMSLKSEKRLTWLQRKCNSYPSR